MRDLLIGFAMIAAAILNWPFDLAQKYQRQFTKSALAETALTRFANRYYTSGFLVFIGIFWIAITRHS